MLPAPPTSTLFPYTTLFRSELQERFGHVIDEPGEDLALALDLPVVALVRLDAHVRPLHDIVPVLVEPRDDRDRKSTRLNSSHLVISYAVFCLKKKNISL